MRINTKILALAACSIPMLSACDNIKDGDRFIEMEALEAQRVVLLEEYTGQLCVNCPKAHETVKDLLDKFPDNLISVSFHGGGNSNSISEDNPTLFGLRTEESEAYCSENAIDAYPAGVVNRAFGVQTKDEWETSIRAQLVKTTSLNIKTAATLSDDKNTVTISTEIEPLDNQSGYLQLWVVESGIVAIQRSPEGFIQDYVHDHVFRANVNGHGGEAIRLELGSPKTIEHTIAVKDKWNTDNLSIVAFVYNNNGVVQATECEVE